MSTVGQRLREQRELLAISQEAFGQLGGVGKRAQINYEQDLRAPDTDYLQALAGAGVDVLYVVTGRRETAVSASEQSVQISDERRLRLAAEGIFEGLAEIKRTLPPRKLAELIVIAYQLTAVPDQQAKSNVLRLVRAAA